MSELSQNEEHFKQIKTCWTTQWAGSIVQGSYNHPGRIWLSEIDLKSCLQFRKINGKWTDV